MSRAPSDKTQSTRGRLLRWAVWFALGNTLLLLGLFRCYLEMMPTAPSWPGALFLIVAAPGHALSLALVPAVLASCVGLVIPRRTAVGAVLVTLGSALAVAVLVDTVVFRLYRFHLNGMVWNLLTGGAAGELLPLSRATWAHGALEVLGLVGAQLVLAIASWRWVRNPRRGGQWVAAVAAAVLLAGHLIHAWADAWGYVPVTHEVRYLPHYYPLTARNALRRLGLAPATAPIEVPKERRGSSLSYPMQPLKFSGTPPGLNLLVLLVEDLRVDFLTPKVTPHLWRFAKDSWVFTRHYSSGNSTRFGVFGLFYGLYGPYWHAALAEAQPPVLMETIASRGYQLGVYTSSRLTAPEFDRTVFAGVRNRIELHPVDSPSSVERDRAITHRFLEFLDARRTDAPFFGFLFFDAPHDYNFPTDPPPLFLPVVSAVNHLELRNGKDPVPVRNRILNSVHFVDTQLGLILDRLEASGLLANTVVIVTGDHGEEFNENGLGYWGHNGNFSEYQTQVAMVMRWPGRAPQRVTHVTHHVDVAPTLMQDLFGATTPTDRYSNGRHLLDDSKREFVIVSNWNAFSIRQADRVDVVEPSGLVETFHADYRPWPDAPSQPAVMLQAAEALGRFYSR
jgi:membrane-anchored protein YejM (alkaline phosphatase superfamily)